MAGCLEATGAPGGLSVLGPYSRRQSATDLLTAGGVRDARVSARPAARLRLGRGGSQEALRSSRAPPCRRTTTATWELYASRCASPAGRSARRCTLGSELRAPGRRGRSLWRGGRRLGGGRLVAGLASGVSSWRAVRPADRSAPPETVMSWRRSDFNLEAELQAAIDAAGAVTVLLNHAERRRAGRQPHRCRHGGTGRRLQRCSGSPPRRRTGPSAIRRARMDGRSSRTRTRGASRGVRARPRGRRRSRRSLCPSRAAGGSSDPTIAVRSGGGALVAWRTGESMTGVDALTRESAGPFTARRIAEPVRIRGVQRTGELDLHPAIPFEAPPVIFDSPRLQAAVAPDGRVVLAWPSRAGRPPLAATTLARCGRRSRRWLRAGADARLADARRQRSRRPVHSRRPRCGRVDRQPQPRIARAPARRARGRGLGAASRAEAAGDRRSRASGSTPPRRCAHGCGAAPPAICARSSRAGAAPRARGRSRSGAPEVIGVGTAIGPRTRRDRPSGRARDGARAASATTVRSLRVPVDRPAVAAAARPARRRGPARRRRDRGHLAHGEAGPPPDLHRDRHAPPRAREGGFDPTAYELRDGGGGTRFRVRMRPAEPDRIVSGHWSSSRATTAARTGPAAPSAVR